MSARRRRPAGSDAGPQHVGRAMSQVLGRMGASTSASTMELVFSRWEEVVGAEGAGTREGREGPGARATVGAAAGAATAELRRPTLLRRPAPKGKARSATPSTS